MRSCSAGGVQQVNSWAADEIGVAGSGSAAGAPRAGAAARAAQRATGTMRSARGMAR
jgi:hypothetical protein